MSIYVNDVYSLFSDEMQERTGLYAEDLVEEYKKLDIDAKAFTNYMQEQNPLFESVMKRMGYDPEDKAQLLEGLKELYEVYRYGGIGYGDKLLILSNYDVANDFFNAHRESMIDWVNNEAFELDVSAGEFLQKHLASEKIYRNGEIIFEPKFDVIEDLLDPEENGYQTKATIVIASVEELAYQINETEIDSIKGFVDSYDLSQMLEELEAKHEKETKSEQNNIRTNQ